MSPEFCPHLRVTAWRISECWYMILNFESSGTGTTRLIQSEHSEAVA